MLCRENGKRGGRLGLAISKKHCKRAVGRNRLKRLVRESFRRHRAELQGCDVVVLNKPGSHLAGNQAIFDSLAGHWQRCRAGNDRSQEEA